MAKRIMQEFLLSEISAVDRPAQKGAKMTIMKRSLHPDTLPPEVEAYLKREFSEDKRKELASTGAALPDGSYPIENKGDLENAIRAVGRAKNKAKARAHIISRARSLGATSMLPDDWKVGKLELLSSVTNDEAVEGFRPLIKAYQDEMAAVDFNTMQADAEAREYANGLLFEIDEAVCSLRCVFDEIACDASAGDKRSLLQESFDQFKAHIQRIIPEGVENALVALALAEAGFSVDERGGLTKREAMDIRKLLGLPATATEADIKKALDDRAKLAKFAEDMAKMSPEHVAYMLHPAAKLDGGKEAFAALTAEKREEIIKAYPAMTAEEKAKADKKKQDEEDAKKRDDEVLKVGGTEIRKSVVGEATFNVMKAQQEDIAKLRDKDEINAIAKRCEPLTFIGKADEIAGLIHSIQKHDAKLAKAVEDKFTQLQAVIAKGATFTEFGKSSTGQIGKAADSIDAAARELMKNDSKLTIFKARDMARKNNPELAKQEEQERKEANAKNRAA